MKAKARGRSEAPPPQPMNQKQKCEESFLRMWMTSLRVTGNPIGNEMQEKEQRMLDRENGKKREFLLVFFLGSSFQQYHKQHEMV